MNESVQVLKKELFASKGKSMALGFFLLVAVWTWCGILFGNEPEPSPPMIPGVDTDPIPMGPIAEPIASSPETQIHSFDEAWERLRQWSGPLGLAATQAEELEVILPGNPPGDETSYKPGLPQLSGTALLGPVRWAFLDGVAVQEGHRFGRYFVGDVRPREVVLLDGTRSLTLRMESWNSLPAPIRTTQP